MQAVTQSRRTKHPRPGMPHINLLTQKLYDGEPVSETEWMNAYSEVQRPSLSEFLRSL